MDVNEHERRYNIILRYTIKHFKVTLVRKDMGVNEHKRLSNCLHLDRY
jgi:hypothetical protein